MSARPTSSKLMPYCALSTSPFFCGYFRLRLPRSVAKIFISRAVEEEDEDDEEAEDEEDELGQYLLTNFTSGPLCSTILLCNPTALI